LANHKGPFQVSRVKVELGRAAAVGGRGLGILTLGLGATALLLTRESANRILSLPPDRRPKLLKTPQDYGLVSEDLRVTAEDGLVLHGWYIPGRTGATIMIEHGSPGGRQDGLVEAAFLNKRGYNVLLGSFRAHDDCDGQTISLGYHELKDIRAWHHYLLDRPDVDPRRIGIFGESLGAMVAIHYASQTPGIAAVAAAGAPATIQDAVAHTIAANTPVPDWSVNILARLMVFWGERLAGCSTEDVEPLRYVGDISPRPLLIMHGGRDKQVPARHGRLLYEAAGRPRELWLIQEAGHVDFEKFRPAEYEQRLLAFFDRYLLHNRS
jgi:fermentation-respiration switch protein FrsA (DUF1100 family)